MKLKDHYDVIIIGGGITGAGTARDCSMRGLRVLLVERHDFTHGATGRNHGLLHSGARYAVTDQESATECIVENKILRRIAPHCVEEHDGLFITLPEDDLAYQQLFVDSCLRAGIRAEIIDPKLALKREPSVNPDLIGAVVVPDGSIDPFLLTMSNVLDARRHGADMLTYHEASSLIIRNGRVEGVNLRNTITGERMEAHATITINAAGIWGMEIARMAGVTVNMFPAKGSLLVFGHRVNNMVINRCRKPANADILVPGDVITVIGTTSERVPMEEVENMRVTPEEVDVLLKEGCKLAPSLASTRILRAYAGVRPLVASDHDTTGRSISRGIVCLDHEVRDGLAGFITITGGKLMTYRLMAEMATDKVCEKLNIQRECETAITPLPNPEMRSDKAFRRHGTMTPEPLVCECEGVSRRDVQQLIDNHQVTSLSQLRRRTRLGMGTCQGQLCAYRAERMLEELCHKTKAQSRQDVMRFLNERWKGMAAVAWGPTLSECQLMGYIYQSILRIRKEK